MEDLGQELFPSYFFFLKLHFLICQMGISTYALSIPLEYINPASVDT